MSQRDHVPNRPVDLLHGGADRWVMSLDKSTGHGDRTTVRGAEDLTARVDVGGERLFHQHRNLARDQIKRHSHVMVRRRSDYRRVAQQRGGVMGCAFAPESCSRSGRPGGIGVDDHAQYRVIRRGDDPGVGDPAPGREAMGLQAGR